MALCCGLARINYLKKNFSILNPEAPRFRIRRLMSSVIVNDLNSSNPLPRRLESWAEHKAKYRDSALDCLANRPPFLNIQGIISYLSLNRGHRYLTCRLPAPVFYLPVRQAPPPRRRYKYHRGYDRNSLSNSFTSSKGTL